MKRWIPIVALALTGCPAPSPAPPPALTAPSIIGVYTPPVAAPMAAVPTAIYYGYPSTYGVMLCLSLDSANMLCWYPPA